jgi:hypothetical protein
MRVKLRTYSDIRLARANANIELSDDNITLADENFEKEERLIVTTIN